MVKLLGMTTEHDHRKCRGCGGRIAPTDKVVEVGEGHLHEVNEEDLPDFEQNGVWGYMHQHCFLVAVGDPAAIFAIEPAAASAA
jgi:hypothetical protein